MNELLNVQFSQGSAAEDLNALRDNGECARVVRRSGAGSDVQ